MRYRFDIDGLRAVSVLLVLLFHLAPSRLTGGFVGVDVFFVISGYLMTRVIADETRDGTFTLAGFYARRSLTQLPIEPEDQAEAIFLLASQRLSKTTGHILPVDGGLQDGFLR